MEQGKPTRDPQSFFQKMWFSFLAFIGALGFLAYSSERELTGEVNIQIFSVVALIIAALSFVVPKMMAKANKRDNVTQAQAMFVPYMVAWAMSESVAILGLMVGESHGFQYFLPYGAAAVALMIVHRPQLGERARRGPRTGQQ